MHNSRRSRTRGSYPNVVICGGILFGLWIAGCIAFWSRGVEKGSTPVGAARMQGQIDKADDLGASQEILRRAAEGNHARGATLPSLDASHARQKKAAHKYSKVERHAAAVALVQRVVGRDSAALFLVTVTGKSSPLDQDTFEIADIHPRPGDDSPRISLKGTSGVAVASALNWYLRYLCKVDTSWNSALPLRMPESLPAVGKVISRKSNVRYSYFGNVCTHSYSQAWWDWGRWEREIDWMALNGINLPLALTGQEAITQRVFRQLGLTDAQISEYFTGPAFLAWFRMLNIKAWGGGLPQSWIDAQQALQHRILDRERSLGMTPVLPAFAGGVPEAMREVYPEASMTRHGNWGGFSEEYTRVLMVAPSDPLFRKIGSLFLKETIATYGTDHIYSCDTFNENRPSASAGQSGLSYLTLSSQAVIKSMEDGDSHAVWLMQGWLFMNDSRFWQHAELEAYLRGVPHDRLLLLDLFADVFPVWKRKDLTRPTPIEKRRWVWSMLHSFGGNSGIIARMQVIACMYGRMQVIAKDPVEAKRESHTMEGIGITTEGIEQNPAVYELMAEMRWHSHPVSVRLWLDDWAARRLGPSASEERVVLAQQAWQDVGGTVYNCQTTQMGQPKSMIESRPRLDLYTGWIANSDFMPIRRHYPESALVNAWKKLMRATLPSGADKYEAPACAVFDLVDFTRQVLADTFARLFVNLAGFVHVKTRQGALLPTGDIHSTSHAEERMQLMLELIRDLDALLATQPHLLLGRWIATARGWGRSKQEEDVYEFNARNLVTLWGPRGEISDYASKQWSGLLSTYYLPRWELFFQNVGQALREGTPFDQHAFERAMREFEQGWQKQTVTSPDVHEQLPEIARGDALRMVERLSAKYGQAVTNSLQFDIYAEHILPADDLFHAPRADLLAEQLQGRT